MGASYYEQCPEAFAEAAKRKAFQDQLLEGTGLLQIISSDPENPNQARAKNEILLLVERAWNAVRQATDGLQNVRVQVTA